MKIAMLSAVLCALLLGGCASEPAERTEPRPPQRLERCDAFGCCMDEFGRRHCYCDPRFDASCSRYNDPYWRERENQRRNDSRDRDRLPLPPLPPSPIKKLPRPF